MKKFKNEIENKESMDSSYYIKHLEDLYTRFTYESSMSMKKIYYDEFNNVLQEYKDFSTKNNVESSYEKYEMYASIMKMKFSAVKEESRMTR